MTDPMTGVKQQCFLSGGFMVCNFILRKGTATWTKSGKWWRFPAFPWLLKKKKRDDEVTNGKTVTPLKEMTVLPAIEKV